MPNLAMRDAPTIDSELNDVYYRGMQLASLAIVARAYVAARWRMARLRSPNAVRRYQQRQLARLIRDAARDLPFYRAYTGVPFDAWPVLDKAAQLADFAALNQAGLTADAVRAALIRGEERIGGHLIGMSTGTSGNRGVYVITEAERFVWLGTILAKTLPDALWRRHRVALALPAVGDLYRSATVGSRIALRFFDSGAGPDTWVDALGDHDPDTIVASPKILRWLAERGRLHATRIFSGAEVLDPLDRVVIEGATGRRVRQIYMATEGLFGVACAHGTLHLAEDVVHFDYERPDPAGPLVTPIVTDFTRRAQAMIRYHMNDLLELDPTRCPCGSAFQAVKRVEGRADDAFLLADASGEVRMVTPDLIRNAVVDADPAILDFRVVQTGVAAITVSLDSALPALAAERARLALERALGGRGLRAAITLERGIEPDFTRKLRRVRRDWRPDLPAGAAADWARADGR
ncbi:F390 synthetase-related protein [Sphingomonas sp. PB4P5]|uniref:F390 synthetase-related protein n=1 Tax=Parasphingomonas puruogangriensis TaxID=3096155 RepID=UPI002FC8CE6D